MKQQSSLKQNLFDIRNRLKALSLLQFKKYFDNLKIQKDIATLLNLLQHAYDAKRDNFVDYYLYFSDINSLLLEPDAKLKESRNILAELCLNGRIDEVKQTLKILSSHPECFDKYNLCDFMYLALNNVQKIGGIDHSFSIIKQLVERSRNLSEIIDYQYEKSLVGQSLEKESYNIATYLLEKNIYEPRSDQGDAYDIVLLMKKKWTRRQKDKMLNILSLLLELNPKIDPRQPNRDGKTLLDIAQRDQREFANEIEDIIRKQEQKRKQGKKSSSEYQNNQYKSKGKSEFGGRQLLKKSNQVLKSGINNMNGSMSISINNSKEVKPIISIQSPEDEAAVRKQADKIYEKYINQKEKHFKVEQMQAKKEIKQNKNKVICSEELRYYLQEEIKYETQKIKAENNRCKQFYEQLISKIKDKLTQYLPITVEIFGSFATNLCLPESDIDVVIIPKEECNIHSFHLLESIHELLLEMKQQVYISKLIKTATVPIIKVHCTDKYYEKKIDITYRDTNHNGLESVRLINKYLKFYDVLEPLIFILKKFIYTSNLFAPYSGGISSYGLILMIVAYIQNEYFRVFLQNKKNDKPHIEKPRISELLIGFLKFYGFKMDYIKKCICIHDPDTLDYQKYEGCLIRHVDPTYSTIIDLQPKLVIIDPQNPNNNVGRSTHKIKHIRMAFEIAYMSIHTNMNCGRKKKCELFKRIKDVKVDIRYEGNSRPCCILKKMFKCTQKFIKNEF